MRDALDRGRPRPDDGDPLVGQAIHRRAVMVAAGVGVVPAAGVEGVAFEVVDAGDPWQLRDVQRSRPDTHELGSELVSPVRPHDPAAARSVPLQVGDLGVKEGVVIQAVMPGDPVAVRADLRGVCVPFRRHVPGLLKQRHVDHRGGVALRAGVAIPVPSAAEAAAFLHDPHVLDAGLPEPGAGHQPGEASADEGDRHVVALGITLGSRGVGVIQQVAELLALELQVLIVAVRSKPLVPLLRVPAAQGKAFGFDHGSSSKPAGEVLAVLPSGAARQVSRQSGRT